MKIAMTELERRMEFAQLKQIINKHESAVMQVADALERIRDEELYKLDGFSTFHAWAKAHCSLTGYVRLKRKELREKTQKMLAETTGEEYRPGTGYDLEVAAGGTVYFAVCGNKVKIGWTGARLSSRISEAEKMVGEPASLIGYLPGSRDKETQLHRHFAAQRIHGEWFKLTPEMMEFIETNCAKPLIRKEVIDVPSTNKKVSTKDVVVVRDAEGNELKFEALKNWARREEVKQVISDFKLFRDKLEAILDPRDPIWHEINFTMLEARMEELGQILRAAMPHAVCTECQGAPSTRGSKCGMCGGKGLISKTLWDSCVPEEKKELMRKVAKGKK